MAGGTNNDGLSLVGQDLVREFSKISCLSISSNSPREGAVTSFPDLEPKSKRTAEATAAKREPDGWPKSLWATENHLLKESVSVSHVRELTGRMSRFCQPLLRASMPRPRRCGCRSCNVRVLVLQTLWSQRPETQGQRNSRKRIRLSQREKTGKASGKSLTLSEQGGTRHSNHQS